MKDSTIRKYARECSAIQSVYEVDECVGLKKFKAECITDFRGQSKEHCFYAWAKDEDDASKKLNSMRVDSAFEILKYQFRIGR